MNLIIYLERERDQDPIKDHLYISLSSPLVYLLFYLFNFFCDANILIKSFKLFIFFIECDHFASVFKHIGISLFLNPDASVVISTFLFLILFILFS